MPDIVWFQTDVHTFPKGCHWGFRGRSRCVAGEVQSKKSPMVGLWVFFFSETAHFAIEKHKETNATKRVRIPGAFIQGCDSPAPPPSKFRGRVQDFQVIAPFLGVFSSSALGISAAHYSGNSWREQQRGGEGGGGGGG